LLDELLERKPNVHVFSRRDLFPEDIRTERSDARQRNDRPASRNIGGEIADLEPQFPLRIVRSALQHLRRYARKNVSERQNDFTRDRRRGMRRFSFGRPPSRRPRRPRRPRAGMHGRGAAPRHVRLRVQKDGKIRLRRSGRVRAAVRWCCLAPFLHPFVPLRGFVFEKMVE